MKKRIHYLVGLLLLAVSFIGQAQDIQHLEYQAKDCGTTIQEHGNLSFLRTSNELWQRERVFYKDLVRGFKNDLSRNITNVRMIPVQLHIIRANDGTGGILVGDLESALALVNEYLIKGGIYLYQCSSINYIDDNTYYDYEMTTEMSSLHTAHSVNNVLNIYFANSTSSNGNSICGHSQFPGGLDFTIIQNECALNGSTFVHEIGHYLCLYHTHETYWGNEAVNGLDCLVEGDLLCDTPADPDLSNVVNSAGCSYTGTTTDENMANYNPSPTNIMSYSLKECRTAFTEDQYARMLWCIDNYRTYLSCSTSLLASEFYSIPYYEGCADDLTVEFCNVSTGNVTTNSWDFGDGNTSTSEAPTHTYTAAGSYNVSLVVGDGSSTDIETKTYEIAVGAVSIPYLENFEAGISDLGRFRDTATYKNYIGVSTAANRSSTNGLAFYGFGQAPNQSSPFFIIPSVSTAFEANFNPYFKSAAYLCVDGRNQTGISLSFDLKQMYAYNSNYSNLRITINGVQIAIYQADGYELWSTKSLDLSAYDGTMFILGFEGSHKYGIADNATFIDNISISKSFLPVELISFNAEPNEKKSVNLDWKTATQENFSHFVLEHSIDGKTFTPFDLVKTENHTTQEIQNYENTHLRPRLGQNYYRLKMVDINETFEYSDIKVVDMADVEFSEPKLFPNPAIIGQSLELSISNLTNAHLFIYQLDGKLVRNISLKDGQNSINTIGFASGTYFYSIQSAEQVYNGKLIFRE